MNSNIELMHQKRKEAAEKRKALGLPAYRTPIEKSNDNPESLRSAINAKCFECVGMGQDSNWRDEVRACSSLSCPLFKVRKYK